MKIIEIIVSINSKRNVNTRKFYNLTANSTYCCEFNLTRRERYLSNIAVYKDPIDLIYHWEKVYIPKMSVFNINSRIIARVCWAYLGFRSKIFWESDTDSHILEPTYFHQEKSQLKLFIIKLSLECHEKVQELLGNEHEESKKSNMYLESAYQSRIAKFS